MKIKTLHHQRVCSVLWLFLILRLVLLARVWYMAQVLVVTQYPSNTSIL